MLAICPCAPCQFCATCLGKAYAIFALVLGLSSCTLPGFLPKQGAEGRPQHQDWMSHAVQMMGPPTGWGSAVTPKLPLQSANAMALLLCCLPACFQGALAASLPQMALWHTGGRDLSSSPCKPLHGDLRCSLPAECIDTASC